MGKDKTVWEGDLDSTDIPAEHLPPDAATAAALQTLMHAAGRADYGVFVCIIVEEDKGDGTTKPEIQTWTNLNDDSVHVLLHERHSKMGFDRFHKPQVGIIPITGDFKAVAAALGLIPKPDGDPPTDC